MQLHRFVFDSGLEGTLISATT